MLYFSAHCMSGPSLSTNCHTYRLPVTSFVLMCFKVFNQPSNDSITFRLVLNYCSLAHHYSSCVVAYVATWLVWGLLPMDATTKSHVRAYQSYFRLCTLRCLFLILAASNRVCEVLTDHQFAATCTLQRRLPIYITEKRIASTIIAKAAVTWNPLHFQPTIEE